MKRIAAIVAALAIAVGVSTIALAVVGPTGHVMTGPNGNVTKGGTVTFTVDWAHGSLVLTCKQGATQVLNVTQKVNTSFVLNSPTWVVGPATCHVLWFYQSNGIATRVTEAEMDFNVDGTPPSPTQTPTPPPSGDYTPVVLVVMENRPFDQIAGHAPYVNGLAAQGRLFTKDIAITHPSLPNYMAFTAGSTLGCTTDQICRTNSMPQENFYHQLEVAGISWNAYAEHMPTNCGLVDSGSVPNKYIAHHNPAVYFTNVHQACLTKVRPLSQIDPDNLAEFTFISPGNEHNAHDGSVAAMDTWSRANLQPLVDAGAELIFTFDEGCCHQIVAESQNVYTFVVGPGIAPSTNAGSYNDYSLLAGLEDHFGVTRLLNAASANVLPI